MRAHIGCSALLVLIGSACSDLPSYVEPSTANVAEAGVGSAPAGSLIAAGQNHACALLRDRRTYCWGDNTEGQLGDGSSTSSARPVPVAGAHQFTHLTSGGLDHTCGLTAAGRAFCWGWNAFGQLGDGTTTSRNLPVPVAGDLRFAALDAGTYHTCGVTLAGAAYCWGANGPLIRTVPGRGENEGYALGAPATGSCVNPRTVEDGSPYRGSPWPCSTTPVAVTGGISFRSISAGLWATCGVDPNGTAYCWGFNGFDELGTGTAAYTTAPVPVAGGLEFDDLSLGAAHGCGVVNDRAYCWGGRVQGINWGSLGTGSFAGSSTPAAVAGSLSFATVVASDANNVNAFTCSLTPAGAAYCWGSNQRGALGTEAALVPCVPNANLLCATVPVPVAGGLEFISLAAGSQFACGLTARRSPHCWGRNAFGQLGDGTTEDRFTPVAVQEPDTDAGLRATPFPATGVAAGAQHTCALGVDLVTYCWGDNTEGQLGDGSSASSLRPVPVSATEPFIQLTSGGLDHTCGLTAAGRAYCWGWNAFGQLGDGTTTSRSVPVPVSGNLRFAQLDVGTYHTCGVTAGGAAYCWGANGPLMRQVPGRGETEGYALGAPATGTCVNPRTVADGSPYRGSPWPCSTTPVAVTGGLSFRSISAGLWATCGVAQNGTAYCWGFNGFDELGNGAAAYTTAPVAVAGPLLFDDVSLGAAHGCGIVNDSVYCWGGRLPVANWGSLGTGSFAGSSTPAAVAGGLSFAAVVASDANNIFAFTCGLTAGGSAYCWGSNRRGALGTDAPVIPCDADPQLRCANIPVPVAGGIGFTTVAAGSQFTCGIGRNRATYCWGSNDLGQLGDGTTTDRSTPVLVLPPGRAGPASATRAKTEATLLP